MWFQKCMQKYKTFYWKYLVYKIQITKWLYFTVAFFVSAYVMAEDDECPKVCPFLYSPVCGVDAKGVQRKFANECELKITNCRDKETSKILMTRFDLKI